MIIAITPDAGRLQPVDASDPQSLARAVWIDVIEPTDDERREIERHVGLYVSSAAELQEIEHGDQANETVNREDANTTRRVARRSW